VDYLDGVPDTFYGPLVPSTGYLKVFDLMPFHHGFCLQYPMEEDITRTIPRQKQIKLTNTLKDYGYWCKTTGIVSVGALNRLLQDGKAVEIINLCEARQERKYAETADKIYAERERLRIVFIAGPSSSGKTSSSLRVAQQLKVLGMNPKVIELDNYFVEREKTPLDEDGKLDFEALGAMDLELLGKHLNALLAGEEIEIPRYDFKQGRPFFEGKRMRLEENDILVMEGIHALDPAMVPSVDQSRIYRIYASALTSLKLDENCCISTTDNRLLRRMVRDNRVRGITPEDTILRWPSVRRGENRYIFPFQENADTQFNSALLYELPMLKYYAEPLLRRIRPDSAAYVDACRLLRFLDYIVALQPSEISAIPPTSIMREFIGGQTL
jgi:uridine kinase